MTKPIEEMTLEEIHTEMERISKRLTILHNDDTVGHTWGGSYFTEIRELNDRWGQLNAALEKIGQD